MAEINRLIEVGQTEINNHQAEAQRLHDLADQLVTSAEHHLAQAERWGLYIGNLTLRLTEEIPGQRHLFIVK